MKTELIYLVYVTLLTGLLWVPYVLNRLVVRGIYETVSYSDHPKPQLEWAQRLQKAHANAVETCELTLSNKKLPVIIWYL